MATDSTTRPTIPPRGWAYWIPVAGSLVCLVVAAKRIKTYLTAQDPYWYIGLAHEILGGRSDPAEFSHGLSYISPGFPLLLAGWIKIFGIYAPYWLNPLLAVGFFLLYAELIRHLFPSPISVLIVLPGTTLLLFSGYALNIHFLLYPFRGMSIYFLALLGAYLLCVPRRRPGITASTFLAGCSFTLATAIREPAIFAAAGAATWILVDGGIRSPRAWRRLGWFALPMGIGCIAVAAVVLAQGRALNNQLESWLSIVSGREIAEILGTAGTLAGYLADSVRIPGVVLAVLGVWSCRRHAAVLCLFLLPALAFFLFYALYLPHYRYLLSVLVFLSPILCAGALWAVEEVHPRAPALQIPWVLALCLIVGSALTVRTMDPWGRKVTRRQVEEFRQTLDALAPGGGVAFVDPTCRYLVDALVCYSDLALRSPMQVRAELEAGRRCFHFRPLDERAYYEGYLDQTLDPLGLSPEFILPFYARNEPVVAPDGTPLVIPLANGHFSVEEILPWDEHVVRQRLRLPGHLGHTIWLDFGEQAPDATADIHLEDDDGRVVTAWTEIPARHIRGLYAAVSETGTGMRTLEVRSRSKLSGNLARRVMAEGQSMKFFLGAQRSPSIHYWLHPPFAGPRVTDAKIGHLVPAGRLVLPVPAGSENLAIDYLIGLDTSPGTPPQRLQITGPGESVSSWPISPGRAYALVTLPPPHRQSMVASDLVLANDLAPPGSRIASIAIAVREDAQSE